MAYEYVILQTKNFLQEPLISTGLRPHVSFAADKSTPHRETNHAIMVILPVDRKCVALPIDAQIVYSNTEEEFDLQGGRGEPSLSLLTTWDVSHWVDLVMRKLRENDASPAFLKKLLK